MVKLTIDNSISQISPSFKIGVIIYNDIVINESPQMLKGRLRFFQETLMVELESKPLVDYQGIKEWRELFKLFNTDPNRYRPSHEALYRRIKKGSFLPLVHSGADLNNFFSLQYVIPFGLYDLKEINGEIKIRVGQKDELYEGLNGRDNQLMNKLVSSDSIGPFGSPIVDSVRTKVTTNTTSALQLVYLRPSMEKQECEQLVKAAADMFTHVHGGESIYEVVTP